MVKLHIINYTNHNITLSSVEKVVIMIILKTTPRRPHQFTYHLHHKWTIPITHNSTAKLQYPYIIFRKLGQHTTHMISPLYSKVKSSNSIP